jgi:acyl transferase domain-containing protein/acyl carrier protein
MSDDTTERLKRAVVALDRMKAKLTAVERAAREPIAILGIGCRLPGGIEDPEALWRALAEGRDLVGSVPPDRWDAQALYDPDPAAPGRIPCREGGFLDRIGDFDPGFFGVSPREAAGLDPQQSLLLEVCWEALERAAIAADRLFRSRTGVFVGISGFDFALRRLADPAVRNRIDAYFGSGGTLSVAAGRLSFALGLQGPSLAVDTACSSSLVAAHLACQSLRTGEADLAIVAGVNLLLSPIPSIGFGKARMLAPDGRCKTFSAAADGYGRGEGCGAIVLKRLSDALAAGDPVIAVIRGSAVNHDGPSGGLTVPNGPAQESVIRAALSSGGLEPKDVGYVECHGTGTALGDPIEVGALAGVFGERAAPLLLGAVKANLGHLEAASGIAGLIKAALCLSHRAVPGQIHVGALNPRIPWSDWPLAVPVSLTPWPEEAPLRAGVSAFGFSGTNAHVVLEPPPAKAPYAASAGPHLLALSAKSGAALRTLALRWADALDATPDIDPAAVGRTALEGRARFPWRLAVIGNDARSLAAALRRAEPVLATELSDEPAVPGLGVEQAAEAFRRGQSLRGLAGPGPRLTLPPTPFERQSFPLEPEAAPPRTAVPVSPGAEVHPLLGLPLDLAECDERRFAGRLGPDEPGWLGDHRVFGAVVVPAAAMVEMMLTLAPAVGDVRFEAPLLLDQAIAVQTVERDGAIRILGREAARWTLHAQAMIRPAAGEGAVDLAALRARIATPVDVEALYRRYAEGGVEYGPTFRTLRQAWTTDEEALGRLEGGLFAGLLDGVIQILAALAQDDGLMLPTAVEHAEILGRPNGPLWCHAVVRDRRAGQVRADIRLIDQERGVLVRLTGFELHAAGAEAVRRRLAPPPPLFALDWERIETPDTPPEDATIWRVETEAEPRSPILGDLLERLRDAAGSGRIVVLADPDQPLGAATWGLGAVVQGERPEPAVTLLDSDDTSPAALKRVLAVPRRENRMRLRQGDLFAARLAPLTMAAAVPVLEREDIWLVTGASGALGAATARRLAERGAGHLVLVSRRKPAVDLLAALEAQGVRVTVVGADLAREEEVAAMLAGLPPLTGIVHAAGVIDDGVLAGQNRSRLERVMAAKAGAAWTLHRHAAAVRFFGLYSSVAALLGSDGQVSYGAANGFLDGLARHRRAAGLPAVSIQWSPWAGAGMAAGLEDRVRRAGFSPLTEAQGLDILDRVLAAGDAAPPVLAVLPVDWAKLSHRVLPALLDRQITAGGKQRLRIDAYRAADDGSRRPAALAYLIEVAAEVLRLPGASVDPAVSLQSLGLDSLMAVELRGRIMEDLSRDLPLASLLSGGTLNDLAAALDVQDDTGWIEGEL